MKKTSPALVLSIIAWAIICLAVLALYPSGQENRQEEPQEAVQADLQTGDGRLPGDDIPALTACYMTDEEVREDYENQRIEEALLARAVKLEDVTVTYYDACKACCGKDPKHPAYGITASGVRATPGVSAAVDPAVIPLGSDILVDYGDGVLEYYRADDTGSAVKGNRVDICVGSHAEAAVLGKKTATVYFAEGEA